MSGPEVLVPLTLFTSTAIIAWKFFEGRHRERMAMIEKGISPGEFRTFRVGNFFNERRDLRDPLPVLKWGLLGLFIGGGLLVGIWLVDIAGFPPPTVPAIALLAGGLALVVYYLIANRRYRDELHVDL